MPSLKTIGGTGALLTCPCHAVPLVLLAGGTAGGAWLGRNLPVVAVALTAVFVVSLWLMLRPERAAPSRAGTCATCVPNGGGDTRQPVGAEQAAGSGVGSTVQRRG